MKKWSSAIAILFFAVGMSVWCVPALLAAEHGGQEHGGEEHVGAMMEGEKSDADILLAAADELNDEHPELAQQLRDIAAKL
ncbi:MAG: hypothetical protein A3G87_04585 [Omnitrophica bacterium RIFCSPLOWO2_12_FULL_50_11]|nr:MAG: hypothetical protein A3G87_04585 [Omnitrophica bacterium RIFCSPLOWO2_12_FULL_50_11]